MAVTQVPFRRCNLTTVRHESAARKAGDSSRTVFLSFFFFFLPERRAFTPARVQPACRCPGSSLALPRLFLEKPRGANANPTRARRRTGEEGAGDFSLPMYE
jgi:hypothetical protein